MYLSDTRDDTASSLGNCPVTSISRLKRVFEDQFVANHINRDCQVLLRGKLRANHAPQPHGVYGIQWAICGLTNATFFDRCRGDP